MMFHSAGHADLVLVTGSCSIIIQLGHWHYLYIYISTTYMTGTYCHRTRKSIQAGSGRSDADTSCDLQQFFLLARFYHSSMHGAHLACQASAPWRSPQKRKSKSQEFEDADVFCSWIGVGYMHTSQNTTALAFATPSSQNVI